jgi:prepilin-type N-terminal cleavage/methylation domain-containing protein
MRSRGFTLIELLVVIATIAVLMAILVPVLGKARNQAQTMVCKGNLRNYCLAATLYLDDNSARFPIPERCYFSQSSPYPVEAGLSSAIHMRWCNDDLNLKKHPQYAGPFFRYMSSAGAFACPTFKTLASSNSQDQFFAADAAKMHYKPWYNYTMNAYLGSEDASVTKTRVRKSSEVKRPSNTFIFVEESPLIDTRYNVSGLNDTFMVPGDDAMVQAWLTRTGNDPRKIVPGPDGVGQFYDVVSGFHNTTNSRLLGGKGNCAILDGHVEAFTRADTFAHAYPKY